MQSTFRKMPRRKFSLRRLALAVLVVASAAVPRPKAQASGNAPAVEALRPAGSCQAVRERLVELLVPQLLHRNAFYYHYPRPAMRGRMGRVAPVLDGVRSRSDEARPAAQAAPSGGPLGGAATAKSGAAREQDGPRSHTSTNVQEVGVDESDMVKTDGKFIYTVYGQELLILKSWPADRTNVVARVKLADARPTQLFLKGNRLAVFSAVVRYQPSPWPTPRQPALQGLRPRHARPAMARSPYYPQYAYYQGTRVTVLELGDRTQPAIVKQFELEGNLLQGRMIGGDVYLVSSAALQLPPEVWQSGQRVLQQVQLRKPAWQLNEAEWKRLETQYRPHLKSELRRALSKVQLLRALPQLRTVSAAGQVSAPVALHGCSELYLPKAGGQLGVLTVTHFDLDWPMRTESVGVLSAGMQVYASTDALYVATGQAFWNGWSTPAAPTTQLHRFVLRGEQGGGHVRYQGSGAVPGWLLNQFSLSEYQGHLRVATTEAQWAGAAGQSGNSVFVLRPEANQLKVVGSVRGLAPGERIYAARMMGDKGYVVTFRQTDPLYTLDLSKPENPRVVGELKVNGFSSYIHPLDKDHLLTIGQDADDNGRVRGVHLQIFDVSNFKEPRRSHHHRFQFGGEGYSYSTAQNDHHAFTYDAKQGVLAIPLSYYNYRDTQQSFNGLALFKVGKQAGFVELGRISHRDLVETQYQKVCERTRSCSSRAPTYMAHAAPIQRSLLLEDVLFTLSGYGLKANRLQQPGRALAAVTFFP